LVHGAGSGATDAETAGVLGSGATGAGVTLGFTLGFTLGVALGVLGENVRRSINV